MPFAAAIRFKENGTPKYFNPAGLELERDDFVWVKDPASGGIERIGFVSSMEGRAAVQMGHLPRVLRYAAEPEIEAWYELKIQEREMLDVARERAGAHDLPIKVSDLVCTPEKRQVLIIFTSDHRIDFRELVKDLSGHFKARIEMWQIGARKEAGMKDGYGVCGNPLCCGSWLKDFPSITMRYAKEQDIVQPPSKLSGPCGKLRCCLRYEHETYLELADGVATKGCRGCSSGGKCGVVVDRNLLKGELTLKTEEGSYVSVSAAGFVEEGAEPGAERRESRRGGREEPRRWAPGEPPSEDEYEEPVIEEDESGISARTGSRDTGSGGTGPAGSRAVDARPPGATSLPRREGLQREGRGRGERGSSSETSGAGEPGAGRDRRGPGGSSRERGRGPGRGDDEGRRRAGRGTDRDRGRGGIEEKSRAEAALGGDARSRGPESAELSDDLRDDRSGSSQPPRDRERSGPGRRRRRGGPRGSGGGPSGGASPGGGGGRGGEPGGAG
jgi:cell fate regulator YaaT (PSP1 superfamily)